MKVIRENNGFAVDSPIRENVIVSFNADPSTQPYDFEAGDPFGPCKVDKKEIESITDYWYENPDEFTQAVRYR